jgi:hypothetical protein
MPIRTVTMSRPWWLASLLLLACGGSEPPAKTLGSLGSWTASSEKVTRAWLAGAVPTTYASRTLNRLREQFRADRAKLADARLVDSATTFRVVAAIDTTLEHAAKALHPENAATIRAIADALAADGKTLDDLEQREKARGGK